MVCKLRISKDEELPGCPYCGNAVHRDHFLEWFYVNGFCPICGRRLEEEHLYI
jgi:endogenous inhibitor of DNA gyrase (YacG/DUF329 family)